MSKLFISYAHADREMVIQVSKELQDAGHEVWIDTHGIQGGTLWGSEIAKAIINCDVLLLFLSPRSVRSDYVRREVDIAFDEKRKILPIMIERVDIPVELDYQLAGIQYIDSHAPDWKSRLWTALGVQPVSKSVKESLKDTGKLKNPFSSLPVLEPIEGILIRSNRKTELEKAVQHLEQHRLLLVTGMPGIGKSTFARALLEFMPPGAPLPFWYNFERQRSSGNSLSVLLDSISSYLDVCLDAEVRREVMAFRNPPGGNASVHEVDTLISFLNQDIPIWLVFDNLEMVLSRDTYEFLDEGLELLFDSLKANTHNAKIIITNPFIPILKTGELFLEAGTSALILQGLNDDFTFAFLRAFGLQDRSKEELEPLIREINGHPFVLNHIARYNQAMGSKVTLENLPGGLEEINERFGDFLKERLSLREFNALQALTILNRDVPLAGLCQVAQVKPQVIMHLREKGLLQANEAGRFWLHNIVRNSLKPTEPDFIRGAHVRAMNFHRSQESPIAPQSIEDYKNVLEWHYHAVEAGDAINSYSALYATGLKDQLVQWNEYDLLIKLSKSTLSAVYYVEANVGQVEANLSIHERINIYHSLGVAYFLSGDCKTSIDPLRRALELLQQQDDQELRIKLMIDLAESYNGIGDFLSAMELCQQLANLLPGMENEGLQAKFLHLRGIIHRDRGLREQAIHDLEEALKLYKRLGDEQHTANCTIDLGVVYYQQHRFPEAVENYRRAIEILEARQDMRAAAIAHFNIGDIMLQDQQYDIAEQESQAALNVARQRKFRNLELLAGLALAESKMALSKLGDSQRELTQIKPLIAKSTYPCVRGLELYLTACLHWRYGHREQAHEDFQTALKLLAAGGCDEEKARAERAYDHFMKEQAG